jgi:TPR repeat protein
MRLRYLVAAALIAFAAAPLSGQSVKAGIDAWQRADYAGAIAIWRPLAETGDADAQFNLGQAYRLGKGVPLDLGAAQMWFERAATSGHLDAQTTLGLLLFQNGNQSGGIKWLSKAAEQGEPRALLVYGTALYNGDGVTQDRILGYAYVSRAAAQGLVPAQQTLSELDQLVSAADRKKALALARAIPGGPSAPARKPARPPRVAQPKPAPLKPAVSKPVRVAAAKPTPVASGAWRIQLGAFSQRALAQALYQRLSGKPALAGRGPIYIPVGSMTRLQVGPFASRAAAQAACASLGIPCFPVSAR